ncbi:MAG TPA: electron transfer flavoprotein subunit alpha [Lentisphaeria bacterium]|nr:MAG: electron transfer flavoprotein subunit alpha [Lentisphaerae bacterium GWF2_38_69]HBM16315.1 electron transfer flavoprotein subunit alpha [Lentisphaeria bacterium]
MPEIKINHSKITDIETVIKLCPFGAIEVKNGKVSINELCKLCRICILKGPKGAFELVEKQKRQIVKEQWKGIAVYADHFKGHIHGVTYELIGKAREMAKKLDYEVYALICGSCINKSAESLLEWGVDKVFSYDYKELKFFKIEPYTNVFCDFVAKVKPSVVLVGGTNLGRSLAPRVAATIKTGLTADCTLLDIQSNSDLDQIRPAFGGNIMAHIRTPQHRPQFATVRYKVFPTPERLKKENAEVVQCTIDTEKLSSRIVILDVKPKPKTLNIEEAEVIIAVGRGFKKREDLAMAEELAELLGGHVASSRPLIESGWIDSHKQIGLSGRTVKPKLIITCGISGSIQFRSGMSNSDVIMAINKDKNAPIFQIAHYAIIGDVYELIPKLIEKIKTSKTTLKN